MKAKTDSIHTALKPEVWSDKMPRPYWLYGELVPLWALTIRADPTIGLLKKLSHSLIIIQNYIQSAKVLKKI